MGNSGSHWTEEEKQEFFRNHPSLGPIAIAAAGFQEEHPAVKEALKPVDTVVTTARDAVDVGVNVTAQVGRGIAWLTAHPYAAAAIGVAAVVVLKRL